MRTKKTQNAKKRRVSTAQTNWEGMRKKRREGEVSRRRRKRHCDSQPTSEQARQPESESREGMDGWTDRLTDLAVVLALPRRGARAAAVLEEASGRGRDGEMEVRTEGEKEGEKKEREETRLTQVK